jgi:hypothetical protein
MEVDYSSKVLVLYLERPRATVRVRMRFGRALLIQRLEGSRPQGSPSLFRKLVISFGEETRKIFLNRLS